MFPDTRGTARDPVSESTAAESSLPHARPVASLAGHLLLALRPEQWTKNLVLFAGLIFGQQLGEPRVLGISAVAVVIFCALSSAMYLVNDVVDREDDRRHPEKSRRPIAAGHVSTTSAVVAAAVLSGVALAGAFWLSRPFGLVSVGFVVLLLTYTRVLKHVVILDVLTIAGSFVLRAVAGAVVIAVPISQWLLVCTVLGALFLGLSKRRQEITLLGPGAAGHRRILAEYSPLMLDQMISIAAAATLISYAFYTMGPETVEKFGTGLLTLTLPFPVYGVFRYLFLVHHRDGGGNPAETLWRDRPLLGCVVLWAASVVLIIYRPFGG